MSGDDVAPLPPTGQGQGQGQGGQQQQQQQQPNFLQTILRFIVMYQAMSFFTKTLGGGAGGGGGLLGSLFGITPANHTVSPSTAPHDNLGQTENGADFSRQDIASVWRPAFSKADSIDMYMYVDSSPTVRFDDESRLVWFEESIPLAGWDASNELTKQVEVVTTDEMRYHNQTLYVHCHFARTGISPNPESDEYDKLGTFGVTTTLVQYRPLKKDKNKKNLLSGAGTDDSDNGNDNNCTEGNGVSDDRDGGVINSNTGDDSHSNDKEIVSDIVNDNDSEDDNESTKFWLPYFKPNVTINIVDDYSRYGAYKAPPQVSPYLNVDLKTGLYEPIVFVNDFWLLKDKYSQINGTSVESTVVTFRFGLISTLYWQVLSQMEQSFAMQEGFGAMNAGESDEVKRIFIEGNPYLLVVTMVVSLLHTVFDFFAFKSDIGFWNKNKSMEGLSARMVVLNSFMQLIIFLYLLENDTSMVVLFSSGIGCAIEFWKITKCMTVELTYSASGLPMLSFKDKIGYQETNTKRYDREASVYLSYVLFPLVIGYSVYTLIYESHKSWYSWVLNSLVGAVYTFGFILMCPQLYINYKLKSVAHLPWRQMTFKFLNTIIDDLFAFVIKMPTLHRLSVFRDDLIFCIYLYQRWIYPVDKKRANEFGFAEEKPEIDANGAAIVDGDKGDQQQDQTATIEENKKDK